MTNVTALKVAMVKRGMKTKELAEKCGISYRNLLTKFKNPSAWTIGNAQAVANAMELTRDERIEIFMEEK